MASQGYKIPFLGVTSGKVFVAGEREIEVGYMRDMLESFGEIYSFEMNEREGGKVVVCEYFDRRRATDVIESMNGRDIFVLSLFRIVLMNRVLDCLFGKNLIRFSVVLTFAFRSQRPFLLSLVFHLLQ